MTKMKPRSRHAGTGLSAREFDIVARELALGVSGHDLLGDALRIAKSGAWLGSGASRYRILRFLRKVVEPHQFDDLVRFRREERSAGISATGIVDITTTRLRWKPARSHETDAAGFHYTSGHKGVVVKYQVCTTLQGTIVSVFGPYQGRRHDFALWRPPFPVYEQDLILFDGGYRGLRGRARLPVRKPVRANLNAVQKKYNRGLARYRSRIERVFGNIKGMFVVTKSTLMSPSTHCLFFKLVCIVQHAVQKHRNLVLGARYGDAAARPLHPAGPAVPWT
jgi:hypothetical protein